MPKMVELLSIRFKIQDDIFFTLVTSWGVKIALMDPIESLYL